MKYHLHVEVDLPHPVPKSEVLQAVTDGVASCYIALPYERYEVWEKLIEANTAAGRPTFAVILVKTEP